MRVFAKFDNQNNVSGSIVTTDSAFIVPVGYEEVFDADERALVRSGVGKKIVDQTGKRTIVRSTIVQI